METVRSLLIAVALWFLLLGFLANWSMSLELRDLSIEYRLFHDSGRFPEMPDHRAKEGLALLTDVSLLGPLYWKNRIHSLTDHSQYRLIGLELEVGVTPLSGLEVFYHHHSQHLLEATRHDMPFPVDDSIGLRWKVAGTP